MMQLRLATWVLGLSACAGRNVRTEPVGIGTATVTTRAQPSPPAGAPGIELPRGSYELTVWFDVPRAQLVDWRLVCPGVDLAGTAGETLGDYRERRLAELRDQRDRDREKVAFVTDAIVGTQARVEAPGVTVSAEGAPGQVVAHAVVPDLAISPLDVGRGTVSTRIRGVRTTADGTCSLVATADDAAVIARYQVVRIRDLDAEARERRAQLARGAVEVRTHVEARLVALGADASLRVELQRRRDTELRVQQERTAQLRLEAAAPARAARAELVAWLVGTCNADPDRRARIEDEHARQREMQRDARDRAHHTAFAIRGAMSTYLVGLGAVARPPTPAPIDEPRGTPPMHGWAWSGGAWRWQGLRWVWVAGGWYDPTTFGASGREVVVEAAAPRPPIIRVELAPPRIRSRPAAKGTVIRDHRR